MNPTLGSQTATLEERPVLEPVTSSRTHAGLIVVAIAAGAGALLSAIGLATRSLWIDEGATVTIVSQHGADLWRAIAHDGGNMLLYYLVMHVIVGWFGDPTWLLRLPSVLATAATGGLVAATALRLFPGERRVALGAGLLSVVSLPLVFWGQNARGYAWLVALSIASFLALIAILQAPPGQPPSQRAVVAYVLATLAALYVGFDAALVVAAQLVLLPLFRERVRLVIACLALVALLCLPLLVLALERGSGQLFWVTPLSLSIAAQAVLTLFSAALPPNFHSTATMVPTLVTVGLGVIAGLLVAARGVWDVGRGGHGMRASFPLLLMLSWALIPTLLSLAAYAAGEPIELPRVAILVMPPLALLIAWVLLRPAVTPAFGTAAIAVLLALRLLQVVPAYGVSPEPWRAVTAYVLKTTSGRPACVAFYPQDGRQVFDYYVLRDTSGAGVRPLPVLPTAAWRQIRSYVEDYRTIDARGQARIARQCPSLWLIASHEGQARGTRQSVLNFRRYQRLTNELGARYPHMAQRTFGWAAPIHVTLLSRP